MKKFNSKILATLLLVTMAITGCGSSKTSTAPVPSSSESPTASSTDATSAEPAATNESAKDKVKINIGTLRGPTGVGMLKLMSDQDAGTTANDYNFTILDSPTDMVGKISSKEFDIAAVPTNLAATLYNKGVGVTFLGINTMGMLYIVSSDKNIKNVSDLKGKTIYNSGQGAVPEYVLDYILTKNGLDPTKDVNIQFEEDHSALASMVVAGKADIALLPEPNVTTVLSKNINLGIAINANNEWQKLTNTTLPMGGIIVRTEFLQQHPEAVKAFIDEYSKSIDYTKQNLDDTAKLAEQYKIIPTADIAKAAIPNCNITWVTGDEVKPALSSFFKVLFDQNPKSIGGKIPDEAFYYNN